MAVALAAMCPPLLASNVRRAAVQLDLSNVTPEFLTSERVAQSDAEQINVRNLVDVLRALRDTA